MQYFWYSFKEFVRYVLQIQTIIFVNCMQNNGIINALLLIKLYDNYYRWVKESQNLKQKQVKNKSASLKRSYLCTNGHLDRSNVPCMNTLSLIYGVHYRTECTKRSQQVLKTLRDRIVSEAKHMSEQDIKKLYR